LKQLELLAFFIIELCLVEYNMLKFPPSLLAAAAIYTAQCTLSGTKQWSKTNEWCTGYSEQQLTWVFFRLLKKKLFVVPYMSSLTVFLLTVWFPFSPWITGNAQGLWLIFIGLLVQGS
jgi:hypothetical protein